MAHVVHSTTHPAFRSTPLEERRVSMKGRALIRLRPSLCIGLALFTFLLMPAGFAEAGKRPLRPEELREQADLIVVGEVISHQEIQKKNKDGSQTTHIYLKVRVLEVEKGTGVTAGETIDAACWVITKAPRRGAVWDIGHTGIPGDGGRARLHLQPRAAAFWNVIFPNGIERLDDKPTLEFTMAPPDPEPSWGLAIGAGGTLFLVATVTFAWLFVSRPRPTGRSPGR